MDIVQSLLCLFLDAYFLVLLVRIILSWIPALPEPLLPIARFVRALTDPILLPLRSALPPVQIGGMGLDLSPLVLFFVVNILQSLLCRGVGLPWS